MPLHAEHLPGALIAPFEQPEGEPLRLRRLAVLGPGLLGGSVALAARERGLADEVALWARRAEAVRALSAAGAADVVSSDLSEVVCEAELLVVATPVGALEDLLRKALPLLPEGAVVTDLCSVKAAVEVAAEAALTATGRDDLAFVGAHPMAGSDRTGFSHARANLFEGARCALTPGVHSTTGAISTVDRFWRALGCETLHLEPAEHDRLVARVSHVPHLAASALVNAALGESADAGRLVGPGFRDSTRIAAGAPDMWAEIVAENREAVAEALEGYISELGEMLAKLRDLDNEGVRQLLADAQVRRAAVFPPGDSGAEG